MSDLCDCDGSYCRCIDWTCKLCAREKEGMFQRGLAKGREEGLNTAWRKLDANGARIRQLEEALRKAAEFIEYSIHHAPTKTQFAVALERIARARAALRAEPAPPAGGEQGDQT